MARQLERDYQNESVELFQKAQEERARGREGSALCLERMAVIFQEKAFEKIASQYQE